MAVSTLTDNTGTTGEVNVAWNVATSADFYAWRLYQRRTSETLWTKIYESLVDAAIGNVDTYGWANAVAQEIILIEVTQNATTGELTESAFTGANGFTPTGDTKYTLVHPITPANTVILGITVSDSFTEETESQTVPLLDANGEGGGRKINVGTDFGRQGSLGVQLRPSPTYGTAAAQFQALKALRREGIEVFLRDPFGGLMRIFFGSISVDRVSGVGTDELLDISFPYEQVI